MLVALVVCLSLVVAAVVLATVFNTSGPSPGATPTAQGGPSPANASARYTTDAGPGVNEGTADTPLKIEAVFPRKSQSDEDALSAVQVELVDETGAPAQFGGETPKGMDMQSTIDLETWVYEGSVPSKPGLYHPRFTLKRLFGNLPPETVELATTTIRSVADTGQRPTSGYVYSANSDLWLMSTDAKKRYRLTFLKLREGGQYADNPAWSPDGKQIAFTYLPAVASSEIPATDIWVMNGDGTGMKEMVAHGRNEALSAPAWSKDGKYLYFTVEMLYDESAVETPTTGIQGASTWRIDRLELSTGARKEWLRNAFMPETGGPGETIMYVEEIPDAGIATPTGASPAMNRLVRSNADGSGRVVVIESFPAFSIIGPQMSPDGKWVVFSSPMPMGQGERKESRQRDFWSWLFFEPEVAEAHGLPWDLYMVSANGGQPARLTSILDDEPHSTWLDNSMLAFMGVNGFFKLKVDVEGKAVGNPERLGDGFRHAALTWHGP